MSKPRTRREQLIKISIDAKGREILASGQKWKTGLLEVPIPMTLTEAEQRFVVRCKAKWQLEISRQNGREWDDERLAR